MSEVFISYAWGGESEAIADALGKTFQEKGIKLVRDRNNLGYKGLIREFMQQIGQGKCVVTVISDKYLKSKNCMYELLEISRNGEFYDRIFPIVLKDARIYDVIERLNYIKYWEGKIKELEEGMRGVSLANLHGFREEIDLYTEIRNKIASLVDTLQNMNTLTAEIHKETDFGEMVEAIANRLNEDGELLPSSKNNLQSASIGNYAPTAQGSIIIGGQNITGNTFVGTQNNYSTRQGEVTQKQMDDKLQQVEDVIFLCEEMLKCANRVLQANQKVISQFLIDPTNRQKTYQELAELFEMQTGRDYFGRCRAIVQHHLSIAKTRRVRKVTKSLIETLRTLHNSLYSLELPGSEYEKFATTRFSKLAVVDILHKVPFDEEKAISLSRNYLQSLRDLVEKLSYDITYLKQYSSELEQIDKSSNTTEAQKIKESDNKS